LFYEETLSEYNHDAKFIVFSLINQPEFNYTKYLIGENHLLISLESIFELSKLFKLSLLFLFNISPILGRLNGLKVKLAFYRTSVHLKIILSVITHYLIYH
jgi:hypothetical protein